jgi:hypothetical protein
VPDSYKEWPWALLISTAKHSLKGNWKRFTQTGSLTVGIILSGILGINTISPFSCSDKIVASIIVLSQHIILGHNIFPERNNVGITTCFIIFSSLVFKALSTAINFQYKKKKLHENTNPEHFSHCCGVCSCNLLSVKNNADLIKLWLPSLVSKAQKTSSPGFQLRAFFGFVTLAPLISSPKRTTLV